MLAAGGGRRLGRPKLALLLGDRTFLELAVAALTGGGCAPPVLAVVPPGTDATRALGPVEGSRAAEGSGAAVGFGGRVVVPVGNPLWAEGIGSSVRAGLRAAEALSWDAVVVTLVDTPLVGAEHVRRLLAAAHDGADVTVATWAGRRRTPVLLGRRHWASVTRVAVGDVGARAFLASYEGEVTDVPCDDLGPWRDVDTAADLAALGLLPSGHPGWGRRGS